MTATPAQRMNGVKFGANDPSVWAPAFGATGDGATDDTAALKLLFAAAVSTGRTRVNIPAGNWVFSQKLAFSQNGIHVEGASMFSTRLIFRPAVHSVVFTVGTLGALGTMTMMYALDGGGSVSCGSTAATLGSNFVFTVPGTAIDAIFPPGAYVSGATYTLSTAGAVTNSGGGPTMAYELVGLQMSAGASLLGLCAVERITFSAAGNTQKKVALDVVDCDQPSIQDIYIDSTWTGSNSVGLRLRGRQSMFVNNIRSWAGLPHQISSNPNSSTPNCDHTRISDTYLVPTPGLGNACMLIDSGVVLTDFKVNGDNAWIVDKYGLYWNDTTSSASSIGVRFEGIRMEQIQDATGTAMYFGRSGTFLRNLRLTDITFPLGQNGLLLQNAINVVTSSCNFQANTSSQVHLDISTGVSEYCNIGNDVQVNATVNLGTMSPWLLGPKRQSAQAMPATGFYSDSGTVSGLRGPQLGASGEAITLAGIQLTAPVMKANNTIASASTIAPTAPITHITGTTTINTITPPATINVSNGGGEITLIFDGIAPWSATGNIFVAGTPTTAGTHVKFVWDATTSKWYPSRIS